MNTKNFTRGYRHSWKYYYCCSFGEINEVKTPWWNKIRPDTEKIKYLLFMSFKILFLYPIYNYDIAVK